MICRDAADEKQQPAVAEEEKEDTVTIIDEAPNAIAFFCELLTSILNPEPEYATELTQTQHRTPNSTEHHSHTEKTADTLLTIINTKDLIVLFCECTVM